jgi:hypothetical protein
MDSEVAAGWIGGLAGLGGALVGAAVSVWATRVTQREQARQNRENLEFEARLAREARLSELDADATEAVISELLQLDVYLFHSTQPTTTEEVGSLAWENVIQEHLRRLQLALARIPDRTVHERLLTPIALCRRYRMAAEGPQRASLVDLIATLLTDMLEVAHAHRRGESELPPLPDAVTEAQQRVVEAQERWRQQIRHLIEENGSSE